MSALTSGIYLWGNLSHQMAFIIGNASMSQLELASAEDSSVDRIKNRINASSAVNMSVVTRFSFPELAGLVSIGLLPWSFYRIGSPCELFGAD
jgi:hypothetical protein